VIDSSLLPEEGFPRLCAVMAALRDREGGCPWDLEQTLATLRSYLIEESHELLDAIDGLGHAGRALPRDMPLAGQPGAEQVAEFREELGDVLLQVAFQSQIAKELGWFDAESVARGIADKMVRRHPHVFAATTDRPQDAGAVLQRWEQQKRQEGKGALAGVPRNLPALLRAQRVGEKAARIGFDWQQAADVLPKIDEELAELREAIEEGDKAHMTHELGDVLFAVTSLARHLSVDAEQALRETLDRFTTRFGHVEQQVEARHGKAHRASLDELEALWQEAKALERGA